MTKILSLAAVLLFLTSCVTPTPYRAAQEREGGYTEVKIDANRYRVSFFGNSQTPRETVEIYLLYRAAELTLQNSFDHFVVIQQNVDTKTQYNVSPSPFMGSYGWGRPAFPYYAFGYSWAQPQSVTEYTRYGAIAYISMHKGPPPQNNVYAFDAREVQKNLEPKILRPEH